MIPLILGQIIGPIVVEAVKGAIQRADVPIQSPAPATAALEIAEQVTERVRADPRIAHATNSEPWYQSRVTWGAIVSMIGVVMLAAGHTLDDVTRELLIAIGMALGGAIGPFLTLYGRWKARKPIGA